MNYSKLGQVRATTWCRRAFGDEVVDSLHERAARILEEAVELYQAEGGNLSFAQNIVEKVFSRPVGEPAQELAGVMVTTAIYAEVKHLSRSDLEMMEIVRVENMLAANPEHFRRRHAEKQTLGMSMGSPDPTQTMCDCDCHRPGVTMMHVMPCCPYTGETRGSALLSYDQLPRMLGPRIEGFSPSPGTGLEPHKAALREAEAAHAEQVMWCCEKGKAMGEQICPDCAEASDGYQQAMAPVRTEVIDLGQTPHDHEVQEWARAMVDYGNSGTLPSQEPAHGSETASGLDDGVGQGEIVDPGASQAVPTFGPSRTRPQEP